MVVYLNEFPEYEELKALDKEYSYIYIFFESCGSGYLRFTYNEDFLGKISVDYIEGGYLQNIGLPIRHKVKISENVFYNLNKKNYNNIVKFAKIAKETAIKVISGLSD